VKSVSVIMSRSRMMTDTDLSRTSANSKSISDTGRGRTMAIAHEASVLTRRGNQTPLRIQVNDDNGGKAIYAVQYDRPLGRPINGPELVFDSFHPEIVRLETANGDVLLRQSEPGLPPQCVILVAPGPSASSVFPSAPIGVVAQGEADYQFFLCLKE